VDFIRSSFGDEAATATMGIVYKRIGQGQIDEQSLGDGLVNAIKFIDRNFGVAAGDKVMGFFNADLNQHINEYFDNGKMEQFYAAGPGVATVSGGVAAGPMASQLGKLEEQFGEDLAQGLMDILKQSIEENGLSFSALRAGFAKAEEWLAEQTGDSTSLGGLLHAPQGKTPYGPPPQDLGVSLDIAV